MQTMRLETKDGILVAEVQLPANGEPDAIVYGIDRIFIRRPMKITEPPQKNNPEVYFEATAHHMLAAGGSIPAPTFDKVTEAPVGLVHSRELREGETRDPRDGHVSASQADPDPPPKRARTSISGR